MKRLLPLLALLLLATTSQAQLYVGLHGGVTLPQGFYADSRMSDNEWMLNEGHQTKGGAGRGWAAGLDISCPMPFFPNLEVLLTADFMQGTVNRDIRDYYLITNDLRYGHCDTFSMTLPRYRNIPVLLGLRYKHSLGGIFNLYGEALIGLNIRSFTDWTTAFADGDWQQLDGQAFANYNNIDIRHYATATTLAYRLGAGIIIKESVTLGASFNMLGAAPLTWDRTQTTRYNVYGHPVENTTTTHTEYTTLRPILVTATLGYRLQALGSSRHVQDW